MLLVVQAALYVARARTPPSRPGHEKFPFGVGGQKVSLMLW